MDDRFEGLGVEVQTAEKWLQRKESDLVEWLDEGQISSDDLARILPKILIHCDEPFRPVSIEHVLENSRLRTLWMGRLIEHDVTIDSLSALRRDSKWSDLSKTWLDPKNEESWIHRGWYRDWGRAPIYVQTELASLLKGRFLCIYIFSACQTKECLGWSDPRIIDANSFTVDISRPTVESSWKADILGIPNQQTRLLQIPQKLFIELRNHRVSAECPSVFNFMYKPLWTPSIVRIPKNTLWMEVQNFTGNISRLYQ